MNWQGLQLPLTDAEADVLHMLVVKEIERHRQGYSLIGQPHRLLNIRDKIERCRQRIRTQFLPPRSRARQDEAT